MELLSSFQMAYSVFSDAMVSDAMCKHAHTPTNSSTRGTADHTALQDFLKGSSDCNMELLDSVNLKDLMTMRVRYGYILYPGA